MKIIEVESKTHGKHQILLDDEDYEVYSKYKWFLKKHGNTYYARRAVQKNNVRTVIYMHRDIFSLITYNGKMVDHMNHNGLDNRRENLRICTAAENSYNRVSTVNSTSKYKGVYWCKGRRRWRARIAFNDKFMHLGYFINETDAAKVYNEAALKYHCEFANLNVIGE